VTRVWPVNRESGVRWVSAWPIPTMAAVKIDVSVGGGGKRRCDLVTFEEVPRDVVLGDDVVVWYHVSACYRPKSGDWIGLFQCGDDDDDDDDDCCVSGTYSYVSFQWAPKYPNIEKSIPLRRVVFDNEQIKVWSRSYLCTSSTRWSKVTGAF